MTLNYNIGFQIAKITQIKKIDETFNDSNFESILQYEVIDAHQKPFLSTLVLRQPGVYKL